MKLLLEDAVFPNQFDAALNLIAVGRVLEEWGSLPRRDFYEALRVKLVSSWLDQIEIIEQRLQSYGGQPHFWAADASSCLEAFKCAIQNPNVIVGSDIADSDTNYDNVIMMREYIAEFGALLQSWSALRQASRELHLRGVQLARPV